MTSWSASSGYMSLAVDLSYSGDPASGSVNVHASVTARSDGYGHNFSSTLAWWGDGGSGSTGVAFFSGFGETVYKRVLDRDFTVSTSYGQSRWVKFGASLGPIWNGGNPSVEGRIQIPARAYKAPAAPSSVSVTRVSSTQATVSWQIASSADAPVLIQGIERWDEAKGVWERVGTASAQARSWTDTALPPNTSVTYRVWGDSGVPGPKKQASQWVTSTIAAPSGVRAVKESSGSIVVSWTREYPGTGSFTVFDKGVRVGTVVATRSSSFSFTHVSASASVTHRYTVTHTDNGVTSAESSASNAVQLLAPPDAPTLVGPSGNLVPGPVEFSWEHNPVDASVQQVARVRYRTPGASWVVRTVNSSRSLSATLGVGEYEWQVQTRGLHSKFSPWSAVGVFSIVQAPGVSIVSPVSGETLTVSRATLKWTYYQEQGASQSAAQVELSRDDTILESTTIQGADLSFTFVTLVVDHGEYTARVRVRSGHGMWSQWVSVRFEASFPSPVLPVVQAVWDDTVGAGQVTVSNPQPFSASQSRINLVTNGRGRMAVRKAEVIRNMIQNPSFTTGSGNWFTKGNRSVGQVVMTGADGVADKRVALTLSMKSSDSELSVNQTPIAVKAGEYIGFRVSVAGDKSLKAVAALRFLDDKGAMIRRVDAPVGYQPVTLDEWVEFYVASQVPSDAVKVSATVYLTTGSPVAVAPAGTRLIISRPIECAGDSQEEVVWKTSRFFDGDSSPDEDLVASWTGARGNSESVLKADDPIGFTCTGSAVPIARSTGGLRILRTGKGDAKVTFLIKVSAGESYGVSMRVDAENSAQTSSGVMVVEESIYPYSRLATLVKDGELFGNRTVKAAFTIPSDSRSSYVETVLRPPTEIGESVYVTDMISCKSPTLEQALDYVSGYFDASMVEKNVIIGGQSFAVSLSEKGQTIATPNSPATDHNVIERSVDGGATWEIVADNVPISGSIVDPECVSAGRTLYRVSAVTALPSSASTVVEMNAHSEAMWLSGGDGFALAVPLEWDPKHSTGVGLVNRKVHHFAGRRLGVEMAGTQRQRSVSVSATLLDERFDLVERFEELAYLPAPFLYRDPLGRRIYASLSGVQMARAVGGKWSVSAALEEVDR